MAEFLLGGQRGSAGEYPPVPAANHFRRRLTALALAAAGAGALVLTGRRYRRLVVEGDSMRPTLLPGDRVVVRVGARLRPGDVVALVDPRQPGRIVIKRLAAAPWEPGGGYRVLGDNPASSTDSRHFGLVPGNAIVGRVVWRYWPEQRRGRISLSGAGTPNAADAG